MQQLKMRSQGRRRSRGSHSSPPGLRPASTADWAGCSDWLGHGASGSALNAFCVLLYASMNQFSYGLAIASLHRREGDLQFTLHDLFTPPPPYFAIRRNTVCKIPPLRKYSTSTGVSMRHVVVNSIFPPSSFTAITFTSCRGVRSSVK